MDEWVESFEVLLFKFQIQITNNKWRSHAYGTIIKFKIQIKHET